MCAFGFLFFSFFQWGANRKLLRLNRFIEIKRTKHIKLRIYVHVAGVFITCSCFVLHMFIRERKDIIYALNAFLFNRISFIRMRMQQALNDERRKNDKMMRYYCLSSHAMLQFIGRRSEHAEVIGIFTWKFVKWNEEKFEMNSPLELSEIIGTKLKLFEKNDIFFQGSPPLEFYSKKIR